MRANAASVCAGSNPSCRSRLNASVHKFWRSMGIDFSSRPQPGQKSSFVTKSLGSLAGSFFFVPASALAAMISFSSLISFFSNITSSRSVWNSSASFFASGAVPPPLSISCHFVRYG